MRLRRAQPDLLPLLLLVAAAAAAYSAIAILRFDHWWAGVDSGIFSQAVWHYSNFETPISTIKEGNLLGDHFHPIVALLAPLYWIADDARLLLVAQAVLVAASIVPVFLFARDRLGRTGGYLVAVAYAGFWGIWSGIVFEFHEVAFAPLLIALGVLWGDRRQWVGFGIAMALLLLVKEDMTLVVAAFGLWLLSRREWRAGAVTVAGGLVAYLLVTKVAIPHFAGGTDFAYWTYDRVGSDLPDVVRTVATKPWLPFEIAFDDPEKVRTFWLLLLPFLGLCLCSRISIIAVPLVAERLLSSNPDLWVTDFHYTLPLAPVLAMAAAAGLANVTMWLPEARRRQAIVGVGVAFVALAAVCNQLGTGTATLLKDFRSEPAFASSASAIVGAVPHGASVASSDVLYPRLAARASADEVRPGLAPPDYLALGLFDGSRTYGGYRDQRAFSAAVRRLIPEYRAVDYERGGWVLMRRRSLPGGPPDALGRRSAGCQDLRLLAAADPGGRARTVALLCPRAG